MFANTYKNLLDLSDKLDGAQAFNIEAINNILEGTPLDSGIISDSAKLIADSVASSISITTEDGSHTFAADSIIEDTLGSAVVYDCISSVDDANQFIDTVNETLRITLNSGCLEKDWIMNQIPKYDYGSDSYRFLDQLRECMDDGNYIYPAGLVSVIRNILSTSMSASSQDEYQLDTTKPFSYQSTMKCVGKILSSTVQATFSALTLMFGGMLSVLGQAARAVYRAFKRQDLYRMDVDRKSFTNEISIPVRAISTNTGGITSAGWRNGTPVYNKWKSEGIHYIHSPFLSVYYWYNPQGLVHGLNAYFAPNVSHDKLSEYMNNNPSWINIRANAQGISYAKFDFDYDAGPNFQDVFCDEQDYEKMYNDPHYLFQCLQAGMLLHYSEYGDEDYLVEYTIDQFTERSRDSWQSYAIWYAMLYAPSYSDRSTRSDLNETNYGLNRVQLEKIYKKFTDNDMVYDIGHPAIINDSDPGFVDLISTTWGLETHGDIPSLPTKRAFVMADLGYDRFVTAMRITAIGAVIAGAAIITTSAIAKAKANKAQMKHLAKLKQAESDFLQDPSDANYKALIKSKRKYNLFSLVTHKGSYDVTNGWVESKTSSNERSSEINRVLALLR